MKPWMQQLKESYIKMLTETGSNNPPPEPPLSPSERVFERPSSEKPKSRWTDSEGFEIGDTRTIKDDDGKIRYFVRDWNPSGTERPLQPITQDEYNKIQIKAANNPARGGQSGRFGAPYAPVPAESGWTRHHNETEFDKQKRAEFKKREDSEERDLHLRYYSRFKPTTPLEDRVTEAGYYRDEDGTVTRRIP